MTRVIFIFFLLLVSCRQCIKFNQDGWQRTSDLGQHPDREKMVADLTENYPLKGLTYKELIIKLGQPDFWEPENQTLYYGLAVNYDTDLDPTDNARFSLNSTRTALLQTSKFSRRHNRQRTTPNRKLAPPGREQVQCMQKQFIKSGPPRGHL